MCHVLLFTAWHLISPPFFVPNWPLKRQKHRGNALAMITPYFFFSRKPTIMDSADFLHQQKFVAPQVDFIFLFRLCLFHSTLLDYTHERYWNFGGTHCINVCSVTIHYFLGSPLGWVHGWQDGFLHSSVDFDPFWLWRVSHSATILAIHCKCRVATFLVHFCLWGQFDTFFLVWVWRQRWTMPAISRHFEPNGIGWVQFRLPYLWNILCWNMWSDKSYVSVRSQWHASDIF